MFGDKVRKTMNDIYIIGASGHGREVLWLLRQMNAVDDRFCIRGFVDDNESLHGVDICGVPVLGPLSFLNDVGPAAAAMGIGLPRIKKIVVDKLRHLPLRWPALVAPSAQLSEYVTIGQGCTICANTTVTTQVGLGDFALVNIGATISHDVTVGRGVMISPGVHLTGNVTIGDWVNLGAGVDIIPGVHVGDEAIIGAGTVVIRDVPPGATAVGNPARCLERNSQEDRTISETAKLGEDR